MENMRATASQMISCIEAFADPTKSKTRTSTADCNSSSAPTDDVQPVIKYQNEFAKFVSQNDEDVPVGRVLSGERRVSSDIESFVSFARSSTPDRTNVIAGSKPLRNRNDLASTSSLEGYGSSDSDVDSFLYFDSSSEDQFPIDLTLLGFHFPRDSKMAPLQVIDGRTAALALATLRRTDQILQLERAPKVVSRTLNRSKPRPLSKYAYRPSPRCIRIKRAECLLANSATPELIEQHCRLSRIGARVMGASVVAVPSSTAVCKKPTELLNTVRKVQFYCAYNRRLTALRQQVVQLIHFAFPALSDFNSSSERVEVLMDQLMRILREPSPDAIDHVQAVCLDERACCEARVVVCSRMSRTCLANFRRKVCSFLRYLLPGLTLGPEFKQTGDHVDELLTRVIQMNCAAKS